MPREAVIPLGKRQSVFCPNAPELVAVEGRSPLEWALLEALRAGIDRIYLVSPWSLADTGWFFEVADKALANNREAGETCALHVVLGDANGPAGWDDLVWQGAAHCSADHFHLIDPTLLLVSKGNVTLRSSFLLGRGARESGGTGAVVATVRSDWERSLAQAVIGGQGNETGCVFDRAGDAGDIFAGRAVLPAALPPQWEGRSGWTVSYRHPYETLVESLAAAPARIRLSRLSAAGFDCAIPSERTLVPAACAAAPATAPPARDVLLLTKEAHRLLPGVSARNGG